MFPFVSFNLTRPAVLTHHLMVQYSDPLAVNLEPTLPLQFCYHDNKETFKPIRSIASGSLLHVV